MGCTQGKLTEQQLLHKEMKRIIKQNRKDNQEYLKSHQSVKSVQSRKHSMSRKTIDSEGPKLDFFIQATSSKETKEKYEFLVHEVSKEYPRSCFEPNMVRDSIIDVFDVYLEGKKVYCQEIYGDIRENMPVLKSNINKIVKYR